MRKLTILLLCASCSCCLHGQKIEFSEGINTTCFYSDFRNRGETGETYSIRPGQEISIDIDDFKLGRDKFRVGLKLAQYRGVYDRSGGGHASSVNEHYDINKYTIALEFFPLTFNLFAKVKLNIGGECNCLIYDATTGFFSSRHLNPVPFTDPPVISYYVDFGKGTWEGNKRISAGIITRFAYEVPLSDQWLFTPQFLFYVGITREFKDLSRTMRPFLEIGLARRLK